jgi:hypothetical protein
VDFLSTFGYLYILGANGSGKDELLAGVWVTIDISAAGMEVDDVIEISLLFVGSHDVTVIPEPMTMVLLGLGGLFLRRRK